jgi:hypothetical protein
MPMDPDIKRDWLAALRGGEYAQATGWLNITEDTPPGKLYDGHPGRPAGFCCLGVLCDLAVKAGAIPEPETGDCNVAMYGSANKADVLPEEVRLWAGLEEASPLGHRLVGMNDASIPFCDIANVIEAEL